MTDEPWPSSLSTPMDPPWASTIWRDTMELEPVKGSPEIVIGDPGTDHASYADRLRRFCEGVDDEVGACIVILHQENTKGRHIGGCWRH